MKRSGDGGGGGDERKTFNHNETPVCLFTMLLKRLIQSERVFKRAPVNVEI